MAAPCPPRIREGYLCWQPSFTHQARKEDHTTCHSDWCLPWRHKLKGKEEKVMKRGWRKERAPRAGDVRRWSLTAASSAVNSSHWHSHTYTNHTCVVGALLCGAKLPDYTEDLLSMSLMWEGEESVSVVQYGSNEKEIKRCIVMSETWPLCILLIIRDVVRWAFYSERRYCYPAPIIFEMGCCLLFRRYVIQPQPSANFLSVRALISEMICFHIAALHCATGNFSAWRVPLHNDERKHNLISTFIYRTDCSNGVINTSSAPRCLATPRRSLILALFFFFFFFFFSRFLPSSTLFTPWRMHWKPCKWEQVNKWMFHECFYDEKMQMRMSEWMNV